MFATHPNMAKKWANDTPNMKGLPNTAPKPLSSYMNKNGK